MTDPISHGINLALLTYILPKIIISGIIGSLIGFVREKQKKPAGIKTYALICIGSALFTACSYLVVFASSNSDPSRIVAQIVSGVGFLGAGMVFKSNDKVVGLTSAAFVWTVSALGVLIGLGGYSISAIIGLGLIVFTSITSKFERGYFPE
jgi:putative Mg2+ transporter-C (MgtC) family protein